MKQAEKTLVECIQSLLDQEAHLGVPDQPSSGRSDYHLRGLQYLHGHIDDLFRLRAAELTHHDGVCAAFAKIHNYKYLDDPHFMESMDHEMICQGIPLKERKQAVGFVPSIIKELKEANDMQEHEVGFHPHLDEIIAASQPRQYGDDKPVADEKVGAQLNEDHKGKVQCPECDCWMGADCAECPECGCCVDGHHCE